MMNIDDLQKRILGLALRGHHKDAFSELRKLLRTDSDNPQLLLLMGRLQHMAEGPEKARSYFERACKNADNDDSIMRRKTMLDLAAGCLPASRSDIENYCDPDIVLVQAPGWGINTPPLATAMLTAFARKHGFKALPIDLNIEFYLNRPHKFRSAWDFEQSLWFWETKECVMDLMAAFRDRIESFIDIIEATRVPVVGFTVYSSSVFMSVELARMLKARLPEVKIIFGGPHVSRFLAGASVLKANDCIDAAVQGEGEATLIEIVRKVKTGHSISDSAGILVRTRDGIVDNGDRELIKELNELPAPDFSDFDFKNYLWPSHLPLMSSRGCPNRCIFCNERPFWRTYRGRSADSIFAEIESQISRYPHINFLDFQDSVINGQIPELARLADLIIEKGLRVKWSGQAIIRKEMNVELMEKLKRSGCICMAYGLETPSESLMKKIGKVMSTGADINAIAEAHGKSGLGATYNFMFGLPGETEKDAFEAQEFLRRNRKYKPSVNPSSGFCLFAPGTLVYEDPEKYGIDLSRGAMYWESRDGSNTFISRLKRFEDFCRLVHELGLPTTYPSTVLLDRNRALGNYYYQDGMYEKAAWYYSAWLREHPDDMQIRAKLTDMDPGLMKSSQCCETGSSCEPASGQSFRIRDHSDKNWVNGIADGWATAVLVDNSSQTRNQFATGRKVILDGCVSRRIVRIHEIEDALIVYLEGCPLDGAKLGYPKEGLITD
jgi:radical SAM superfamily enzyme YgiQ (UPF0313 family)